MGPGSLPVSETGGTGSASLPLYPELTVEQIKTVCRAVKKAFIKIILSPRKARRHKGKKKNKFAQSAAPCISSCLSDFGGKFGSVFTWLDYRTRKATLMRMDE